VCIYSIGRSVAIFRETRNGVRPISGAKNQATAIAFGSPRSSCVRPGAHSARHQDSRNDLTPCRMALAFRLRRRSRAGLRPNARPYAYAGVVARCSSLSLPRFLCSSNDSKGRNRDGQRLLFTGMDTRWDCFQASTSSCRYKGPFCFHLHVIKACDARTTERTTSRQRTRCHAYLTVRDRGEDTASFFFLEKRRDRGKT